MFLKLLSKNGYGSSPLTRGTLNVTTISLVLCRFIPAYAGNSGVLSLESVTITVHPRLRGELFGATKEIFWPCGSSPLTRGTHCTQTIQPEKGRFIPAYAGNSIFSVKFHTDRAVHPRLRGELFFVDEVLPGDTGSSPLTRGTLALRIQGLPTMRFIPAYAGNSN